MTTRQSKRGLLAAVPLSVLLMLAAACGDDDATATGAEGSDSGDSGGGSGDGDMTVEIVSPDDGAEVGDLAELELDSSVDIGETDTGLHHFHVHYDGDDENYDIVYEEGAHEVGQDLDEGEHTVQLVLANADHSETDATDEITVMVGSGGSGSGGGDTTTSVDPYDY